MCLPLLRPPPTLPLLRPPPTRLSGGFRIRALPHLGLASTYVVNGKVICSRSLSLSLSLSLSRSLSLFLARARSLSLVTYNTGVRAHTPKIGDPHLAPLGVSLLVTDANTCSGLLSATQDRRPGQQAHNSSPTAPTIKVRTVAKYFHKDSLSLCAQAHMLLPELS